MGTVEVSIVIVSYNHENYIDECIASCISQLDDFESLEIVVADDGSSDRTAEIVRRWAKEYPGIIRPILSGRNTGTAGNFNRGLEAATGTFIAWLGGDDIMLPGKLARQHAFLCQRPDASGCYHDAEVFEWPSGKTLGLFSELYGGRSYKVDHVDGARMLDPRFQMLPSTVMIWRDKVVRPFDDRLRFHNDYLFDFETIACGGSYVRCEGVYARYRKHEGSIGQDSGIRAAMLEENLVVLAILLSRYPGYAKQIRRREIYYIMLDALKSRRAGDRRRMRALAGVLFARAAYLRAGIIFLLGGVLANLTDPSKRRLALKLRSMFG